MGELSKELQSLCRGRGVMEPTLARRVGPNLRSLLGARPGTNLPEFRRQLMAFLEEAAADLPDDLRLAFSGGLALSEKLRGRFLKDRMKKVAVELHRQEDTARTYLEDAIAAVEATLAGRSPASLAGSADQSDGSGYGYPLSGWHLARLHVILSLDGPQPIAFEDRTVVADVDDLAEVAISTAIPRYGAAAPAASRVDVSVRYGGLLGDLTWPSPTYLRYFVRLPRPLRRGETHEIGVQLAIPAAQPFNPKYTFRPLLRCDEFDLLIKFGPRAASTRIWRIAGLPPGMTDDFAEPTELITADAVGEVHLRYERLRIGLAYGVRWAN
jgi:hypothetical protein